MKKDSFEKLDDGFLNLYEEILFVRCFEYIVLLLGEIFGYKVFLNVDKKTGFIFLELGFPKSKLVENLHILEDKGYYLRIIPRIGELTSINGSLRLERDKEKIIKYKNELIKL